MGIAFPWAILMGVQIYKHGIQAKQMPEPFYFIYGTAAMGIAGIVAMANERLGLVLAWGLLLGAAIYQYDSSKNAAQTATANANPSSLAVTTAATGPNAAPLKQSQYVPGVA